MRVSRHAHRFFENVALHVGAALYMRSSRCGGRSDSSVNVLILEHIVEAEAGRAAQRPLDRFLLGVDFDDVEAADQFLGSRRTARPATLRFRFTIAVTRATVPSGLSPSAATRTPALCISSLNFM